jgi:hypothetical protein
MMTADPTGLPPEAITGTAAGVPFVVLPPTSRSTDATAPVVLSWHLMDPPASETAMAAALPLTGLDAWRCHLGLPLCGTRAPAGGAERIQELGMQDAVGNLYGPITAQAVQELPAALAALVERFGLRTDRLGVLGGSLGAAVAQQVVADGVLPVRAAVLVSPVTQLRPLVDGIARQLGFEYPWGADPTAIADRLDFVARADQLAASGVAFRVVLGLQDDPDAVLEPARAWARALTAAVGRRDPRGGASDRVDLVEVPDLAHALAEPPGLEPAPQTPGARTVDGLATEWFGRHL